MFATLLLLATAVGADPLAEARAGKIQCITPNHETRTCMGIASYTMRPDDSFDSVMTMMIAPAPLMTMEVHSSGKVEGDAVCNIVRKADYDRATMTVDGEPANAETQQAIRAQILPSIATMEGKNACVRGKAEGGVSVAEATLDGVVRPELDQRYIWVEPGDGWKIGQ
jgi:hypothetical protein